MIDYVVNRVPVAIRDALAGRGGRLIVLHEVDHPDGYVRAATLSGPLNYVGEAWYGVGDLLAITGLTFSRQTIARTPKLTLAGVTEEQLKFINTKVRGRRARVSLAALFPRSRVVNGDVFVLCAATCDYQDETTAGDRSTQIEVGLVNALSIMDRAPNLKWTPDWMKATYGDDIVGLDDLPTAASIDLSWAPPA